MAGQIEFSCPHCGTRYAVPEDFPYDAVICQECNNQISVPSNNTKEGLDEANDTKEGLDEANDWLERAIGYVAHAIWGVFVRVWDIIRMIFTKIYKTVANVWKALKEIVKFFFSIRFAKFLALLFALSLLCIALAGIVAAPFFIWICSACGMPAETVIYSNNGENSTIQVIWNVASGWLRGTGVSANAYISAWIAEFVWLVLIAGWGIWKGVKSYKYGVIARWRERWQARKAQRRAQKESAK